MYFLHCNIAAYLIIHLITLFVYIPNEIFKNSVYKFINFLYFLFDGVKLLSGSCDELKVQLYSNFVSFFKDKSKKKQWKL